VYLRHESKRPVSLSRQRGKASIQDGLTERSLASFLAADRGRPQHRFQPILQRLSSRERWDVREATNGREQHPS